MEKRHAFSVSPNWANSSLLSSSLSPPRSSSPMNNDEEGNETLQNDISEDDLSPTLFRYLGELNPSLRNSHLQTIMNIIQGHLKNPDDNPDGVNFIKENLGIMVRLSTECPYGEVRREFSKLVPQIEEILNVQAPKEVPSPSYFVVKQKIVDIEPKSEFVYDLFKVIFMDTGRVSHLDRILAWHPTFLEKSYSTYRLVMLTARAGPLPLHMRNYIAILSCAQFRCRTLLRLQEEEFRRNYGDVTWLSGLSSAPKKIQNLAELIALLSYQPWLISKNHIAQLVKGSDAWSMGELVQAMVIITSFKMLCSVSWSCGVSPEVDLTDGRVRDEEFEVKPKRQKFKEGKSDETEKILEALKQRKGLQGDGEEDENQRKLLFESAGGSSEENLFNLISSRSEQDFGHYLGGFNIAHVDFDLKSKEYSVFRVQDYSWKEHGFSLLSQFYPDAAPLLDEQFDTIYTLTYNTLVDIDDVDTSPFRKAVWYYVQRIYGLFNDDYDYKNVNQYLSKSIKPFIKRVCCDACTITKTHWHVEIGIDFTPEEKCHVALLAAEAAKQAGLLYGLHAVMKYML
eukprot:TRINITY_DN18428_c0_g1_i2.p1 TRINITY_DN18428_c0_g1~~TRINITY_DN18428_c0_g1_i2.p1  ORF type:complete len:567 (+),score=78.73 TRINITY_DN18428_c0_g1_i2:83-1783(+)